MSKMTYKEAIDYLQPIADNAELVGYREALSAAIEAMQKVEELERVIAEGTDRCNRQSLEIVQLWERIKALTAELEAANGNT